MLTKRERPLVSSFKKARAAFEHKKTLHALDLILCVIHELMDLLESCDDSDGFVGGAIEHLIIIHPVFFYCQVVVD